MLEAQLVAKKETRVAEPLQMHPMFGPDRPEHISLRASLTLEEVTSMLNLLREFTDVFSWSHFDMPSVLPELAKHRLSVQSGCRLVQQRLRWFHLARKKVIKHKVEKLLDVGFIKEIQYPEWLSNMVVIPKRTTSDECAWIT